MLGVWSRSGLAMSVDGKLRAHFNVFSSDPSVALVQRARTALDKTYCILMTPRSGSTWLTRRIARLDVLSCPDEYFNTEVFGDTLKYNRGRDVYEVFDVIARKNRTQKGLFGFEISYFDLEELELEAQLLDLMVGEKFFFYLNRRNFVAQAISLYTAVESKIFHNFQPMSEPQSRRDVPYDADKIMFWVCHILQQEFGFHQWMTANNVKPMRLRYEELCADIDAVIVKMALHLGVDLRGVEAHPTPQTERVTADCAGEYERRFRNAHWEFCRKWEAVRGTEPCPFTGVAPAL
jgi:trehalose 2-sulfotransferase